MTDSLRNHIEVLLAGFIERGECNACVASASAFERIANSLVKKSGPVIKRTPWGALYNKWMKQWEKYGCTQKAESLYVSWASLFAACKNA